MRTKSAALSLVAISVGALLAAGGPLAGGAAENAPEAGQLLRNGRIPFEGVLTGGQPTPDQLKAIRDLGYSILVNLRLPGEKGSTDPSEAEALGFKYVALPVDGAAGLTEENARRLDEALKSAEGLALVHCGSGNRVGALFAIKAFMLDGKPAEEALSIGLAAGLTSLEGEVKRKLGLAAAEE